MTLCQQKDEEMLHQEKRTWKVHLKETDERNENTKKWGTEGDGPKCSVRGLVRGNLTLAIYSGNSVTQIKSSLNQNWMELIPVLHPMKNGPPVCF